MSSSILSMERARRESSSKPLMPASGFPRVFSRANRVASSETLRIGATNWPRMKTTVNADESAASSSADRATRRI